MSNFVFVIDSDKKPLTPTHPAKARKLLDAGKAAVYRCYPFTIILKRKIKSSNTNAACVGDTPKLKILTNQPLLIECKGNGSRQVIQMDKYGFPRSGYKPKGKIPNWKTGDIVSVVAGKHSGLKNLRIKTVRFKGNFDLKKPDKTVISVSRNHIISIHKNDGYSYSFG